MKFLIQTIKGEIVHDFSFTLLESICYQRWLGNEIEYKLVEGIGEFNNYGDLSVIPIGSVEFVVDFLDNIYNLRPKPINVPLELNEKKFTGRDIIHNISSSEINMISFMGGGDWFIKSNDRIKGYKEFVSNSEINSLTVPKGDYQVSTVLSQEIISEWRGFVFKGELVGLNNYLGRFDIFPNIKLIHEMICEYKSQPVAYTIDIAILEGGENVLIEVHDFFSCGFYGFSDHRKIPYMFSQWFYEYVNKYK